MTRFLTENELTAAIKDVLADADVRCAIADLGSGINAMFRQSSGLPLARIICDVTRGGSSPRALIDLGAPTNENLRHIPDLRSTVFMSNRGAIVRSSNVPGFESGDPTGASLIQVGVFLDPADAGYAAAASWFDSTWARSSTVDDLALEGATSGVRPDKMAGERAIRPGSLIDLVAADPDRFLDISFVFVKKPTTRKQRDSARKNMKLLYENAEEDIGRMPDDGIFLNWKSEELDRWRRTFVEFWMPADRLSCFGRKAKYFDDENGTVMSFKSWSTVKALSVGKIPSPADIAIADRELVERILKLHGNVSFSARKLSAVIKSLE